MRIQKGWFLFWKIYQYPDVKLKVLNICAPGRWSGVSNHETALEALISPEFQRSFPWSPHRTFMSFCHKHNWWRPRALWLLNFTMFQQGVFIRLQHKLLDWSHFVMVQLDRGHITSAFVVVYKMCLTTFKRISTWDIRNLSSLFGLETSAGDK